MQFKALERKLAAILYADVAGYSRLTGEDEEGTHRRLSTYLDHISGSVRQHRGKVLHFAGDAVLADFGTVSDAILCAVLIQHDLENLNRDLPENRKVQFRIGINLGEVIVDRNEIYGDGVNVAARLQSLAKPGDICVSESVRAAIGKKLPLDYEFLGEQQVKNIAEPIRVYHARPKPGAVLPTATGAAVVRRPLWGRVPIVGGVAGALALVGILAWFVLWTPQESTTSVESMGLPVPDKPSIAVLPFHNMGNDPEQSYFADGITEDLITDLSKVSGLFVIARNSTFAYRDKTKNIKLIAKELGVRYLLEGSVRRSGDQVRINAQLIDASTGGHIWADRYDGSLGDVFGLQDRVTQKIIAVLAVQLTKGEEELVASKGTDNAEAYDVFLQGWQSYLQQNPESYAKAIPYFEKAIELDPKYGRAYAALAATYWESWKRFWHDSLALPYWHDTRVRAEEFLAKAMEHPTPLAYQVAADMLSLTGHYDEAIARAEHAIALDSNDANSYIALANTLSLVGRPEEAMRSVERAMRLNPHYPSSYLYQLGIAQFAMEDFAKAAISLEKAVALNPGDRWSHRLLLATYGLLGRPQDAARIFEAISERDKRGWMNFMDPITIRSSSFWHPFRDSETAERFAEGLRKAGVPD